jgi:hypothetical protein
MEVRNGWGARSGVSVASASQAGAMDSYDYVEEKEVSRAVRFSGRNGAA